MAFLAFILLKVPHLSLPFFWDEAGVYGKMVFELADTQLSLRPDAIDMWTSRGHPLLYPNIIAAGCKLFGTTITTAHAVNFFLTCILLISIFFHLRKAFSAWVGVVACVALMAMPMFFAQSVFVLPEIALALMTWWCTWAFITKKYIWYIVFGCAAVLLKEPAVVWIVSIWLASFIVYKKETLKNSLWLLPLIPFGIFMLAQKKLFGWYLFPSHSDGFDISFPGVTEKLGYWISFLFFEKAGIFWTIIILAGSYLLYRNSKTQAIPKGNGGHPYTAAFIPSVLYLLFSCTTFYHERYIMPVLPVLCSAIGYLAYYGIAAQRSNRTIGILGLLILIAIPFNSSRIFNYDLDMSYTRSIEVSKQTIQYMIDQKMFHPDSFSATAPLLYALNDPRYGYMPADSLTGRHPRPVTATTRYVIATDPGSDILNPDNYELDTLLHWDNKGIKTTFYAVLAKTH